MILNDDLMWVIFMFNASYDDVTMRNRLKTTRLSSQVCHNWREILLRSSSIWARLITIGWCTGQEWASEIISRAGSSPLHVEISGTEANITLIKDLLQTRMNQIESLKISIAPFYTCVKDIISSLNEPAPLLRFFVLYQSQPSSRLTTAINNVTSLFNNFAPRLQNLVFSFLTVPVSLLWMTEKLTSLDFTARSSEDMVRVLASTPLLQSLSLRIEDSQDSIALDVVGSQYISLPSLSSLSISATFVTFINFWSRVIDVPKGCYTHHNIVVRTDQVSSDRFDGAWENSMSTIFSFIGHNQQLKRHVLTLAASRQSIVFESDPWLKLAFITPGDSRNSIPVEVYRSICNACVPYVGSFEHLIMRKVSNLDYGRELAICPFFYALSSVAVITSPISNFSLFDNVDEDYIDLYPWDVRYVFPKLQAIHLEVDRKGFFHFTKFIYRRARANFPIQCVGLKSSEERFNQLCFSLKDLNPRVRLAWLNESTGQIQRYLVGSRRSIGCP